MLEIMKISGISVFQVDLPLHEGSYKWSGGKSVTVFDSTVVRVETDDGVIGHGEVCPLGPFYLPSYAAGARAGISPLLSKSTSTSSPGTTSSWPTVIRVAISGRPATQTPSGSSRTIET